MVGHGAVMHEAEDDVAVVIVDIEAGSEVVTKTIEGQEVGRIKVVEDIPLGHKFATRDIAAGEEVIKYGRAIGEATQGIVRGAHVHTHNVKSKRWA